MKLTTFPRTAAGRVHSSHWGSFVVERKGDDLLIQPNPSDLEPSSLLRNLSGLASHRARIAQPMVRRGWLERGPGPDDRRGRDDFVPMAWDEALDLAAGELKRVRSRFGAEAIYGGSYGWSSAGRFHHAQSQVHRFLNCVGGYTASVNSYSAGASHVILPHVCAPLAQFRSAVTWTDVAEHTELIVAFGGMAGRNSAVGPGGVGRHVVAETLEAVRRRGGRFVLVSPLRNDFPEALTSSWLCVRPASDTALMLGIAHTLVTEAIHDREFLDRCCVGYTQFETYLVGKSDACPKSAEWASRITGIAAEEIQKLARHMAGSRTLITVSHSLQRAQYGEQPVWMGLVLACMLGQIGIPGAGFAYSLGAPCNVGKRPPVVGLPPLPQGRNAVRSYIPVARIADMLLRPGEEYDYNGQRLTFPKIHLVYWAGGNPFHHHQDLNRLRQAFGRPDTIIVHEPFWTSTVLHADIVFPCTLTLERNDLGGSSEDNYVTAMHRVLEPYAESKDDFEIFSELADRLGVRDQFTEGLSADQWIQSLYTSLFKQLSSPGCTPPTFDKFWNAGELELPTHDGFAKQLMQFRVDPTSAALKTPSGKLEISSETIRGFSYPDCPGHPAWLEPDEWLGSPLATRFALQLIANQPGPRLHSQLDFGKNSIESKIDGREVMRIHPSAAVARRISDGDLVKVFNDRGAFLAVARFCEAMHVAVIQVATGAWYDPVDIPGSGDRICVNGNPNTVTRDVGTSRLAQGCTGQLCLVEVERFQGVPPRGRGYERPQSND